MSQSAIPSTIITVDYSKSLPEMIVAGCYDWVTNNIAKRFPIAGKGVVQYEIKLFKFFHNISSEDAERRILEDDKSNPWNVAPIECMFAYGAANPEEQRKRPIVAMGSVCEIGGSRRVPYLDEGGSRRTVRLGWWDRVWAARYRFLAVRRLA